jgi:pimeloyl-ACP methyl ester carboxylesterase
VGRVFEWTDAHDTSSTNAADWVEDQINQGNGGGTIGFGPDGKLKFEDPPVILIGHSYGGDGVLEVARQLFAKGIRVKVAIMIDPVGVKKKRLNIDLLVNVHDKKTINDCIADVPVAGNVAGGLLSFVEWVVTRPFALAGADTMNFSDVIATAGGQYGKYDGADVDVDMDAHHNDAQSMFDAAMGATAPGGGTVGNLLRNLGVIK